MTTHPERRAGQRWKMQCTDGRVIEGTLLTAEETWWPLGDVKANDGLGETGRCFSFTSWDDKSKTFTLLDVPAVAPVAADTCKAPEGYAKCPGAACQRFYFPRAGMIDGGCMDCKPGRQVADWTPTPPLAAQPAQQPKPAKGPQQCMWRHAETPCVGPLAERHVGMAGQRESHGWCEGHYLEYERQAYARPASGTPYTGPERLERPKLAHSYGVEDPAMENA